jgi:hypothetical protein
MNIALVRLHLICFQHDDGSCCFGCCCSGGGNNPTNPPPPPPSPPAPGNLTTYCPSTNDLTVGYGNANLVDRGWVVAGGGSAATKSAFNLLGGFVEFDVDFSNVPTGVNANIYTISPSFGDSFSQANYCDGQGPNGRWCVEVDWIETDGNCGGATTLHTRPGPGTLLLHASCAVINV